MYMWWPRILPFIGFTWVYCDRYGTRKPEVTQWEIKVFIIGWRDYAVVLWQAQVPQKTKPYEVQAWIDKR
jgi:hypothetical protein